MRSRTSTNTIRTTPLFLYLAFTAPHAPYQAPKEYLDQYKHIDDPTRRAYAAMITSMDDEIGKVVAALDKKKMRDNTLIVFMSDNGGNVSAMFSGDVDVSKLKLPADNGPYRGGKGMLYEGGTRVAALANWPGRIKAGEVKEVMHVVDMFPTLAGLAGANANKGKPLDGLNVWSTISEGKPSPRQEVVYNIEPFRGGVRQRRLETDLADAAAVRARALQHRARPVRENQSRRQEPAKSCRVAEADRRTGPGKRQVAIPGGCVQGGHRRGPWRARAAQRGCLFHAGRLRCACAESGSSTAGSRLFT